MGLRLELRGQAIGATNHKGQPLVAELLETFRKGNRGQGVALFHQGDQRCIGPQGGTDCIGFLFRVAVPKLADGLSGQTFEIELNAALDPAATNLAQRKNPATGRVQASSPSSSSSSCPKATYKLSSSLPGSSFGRFGAVFFPGPGWLRAGAARDGVPSLLLNSDG